MSAMALGATVRESCHERRNPKPMTLILGMSKAEGIYMSSDYRVTDLRTRKVLDDSSVKFLEAHYLPDKTGPKVLFGYTGVARLPDGTETGDWIRETLRGEMDEGFDQAMAHLQERLDRDFGGLGHVLIIVILAMLGNRRYSGGLSNLKLDGEVLPRFEYVLHEYEEPFVFAAGSGAEVVVSTEDLELLKSQRYIWPRRISDHMGLLAGVNRRAAAKDGSVSPFCHVSFVNDDDRTRPQSMSFLEPGEVPLPFHMPVITMGIDLSHLAQTFVEKRDFDPSEINEHLRRRE